MIRKILIALILSFSMPAVKAAAGDCPIVPLPSQVSKTEGQLRLKGLRQIVIGEAALAPVAHYLQKEFLEHAGMALSISRKGGGGDGKAIILKMDIEANLPEEGYRLNIHPDHAEITASTPHGAFNGVISLLQVTRVALAADRDYILCWQIADTPGMAWRGIMLDESRHFFGKQTVKDILDWMAFYKLNRFHWHLTDVPGWRLEIKQFPKLALIGGIGNYTDPMAPAAYYSQEDIHEIVRYARERFIEVIPEIDMPGHATAANRAYPEYSGGGSEKRPDFTFNPGKEETYAYLSKILREVDALFPSKMIHLGGDEVHFGSEKWATDKDVQHLMEENDLSGIKAVERYFVERMADSIGRLQAKVLGWDEIATTNISPENTLIFWWRHNKPKALKTALEKGYEVVLCPRIPLYFDFVQDSTHISGRRWEGNFSSLERVYYFAPGQYRKAISPKRKELIRGIQANVWTEKIASEARLQYMLFPRITALAEAAWTDPQSRDYAKFMERLSRHKALYEKAGLHYYDAASPGLTPEIIDYIPKDR